MDSIIVIRKEGTGDCGHISKLIAAAFKGSPHSSGNEHILVDRLREAGALAVSLVAEVKGRVIGQIAFSAVTIDGKSCGWYGLAPVSVHPDFQRLGIGGMLIEAGLAQLRTLKAVGCVLLGEPHYYGRFGFVRREGLDLPGVPPEYFLALSLGDEAARGVVAYHQAFAICS